jgi:O-antigen ligase
VSPLGTALIASGGIALLLLGIARPARTIIPFYAALIPIGGVFQLPVPLPAPFNTLSSLVGAMAILATVVHIVAYGRARIPSLPVAAWLVFLAWCSVSAFWARSPATTLRELLIALPLIMLMVAVGILPSTERDLSAVRLAIVAGGAAVGGYALLLLIGGSSLPIHHTAERFSVVTDPSQTDPNQLAATLLFPFLLSLDLAIWGRGPRLRARTWRLVGGVSAVLIVVALALTGSRGGAISAVVGFLCFLFLEWRWHPEIRRAVIGLVVGTMLTIAVGGLVVFTAAKLSTEGAWAATAVAPLQRLFNSEQGTSGRAEIWTTGLSACRQYCGLGAGLGNFPVVFTDLFATSGAGRNVGLDRPGHDLYLELAVEIGAIGITLLGLAIVMEWMAIRRVGSLAPALASALVALLVADGFESFIWFKYFWLLFMVVRLAEAASAVVEFAPSLSPQRTRLEPWRAELVRGHAGVG